MQALQSIFQWIASLHIPDHDIILVLVGFIAGIMTGGGLGRRALSYFKNRARRTIIP